MGKVFKTFSLFRLIFAVALVCSSDCTDESNNIGIAHKISFEPMVFYPTGAGPMAVKTADLNDDSFLDIVVANYDGNTTSILLGEGNGDFVHHVDLWNGPHAGTNGIAIDDINKDTYMDILVVNREANNVGIFLGKGNGDFSQQTTLSTGNGSSPAGLALGDLNGDSILDLVVTAHVGSFLLVFLGVGNGSFTKNVVLPTGDDSGPYLLIINDFNGDDRLDIAVGNGDGDYLGIFFGDGTGKFSTQVLYHIKGGPYALVAIDLNGDDILDIITANYYANSTSVLFGNCSGGFTEKYTFSSDYGSLPYAIALGDFNGDNVEDIILPNSGNHNVGILPGCSSGKFRKQKIFSTGNDSNPVDVAVGDFNGDNKLDFVSVNKNHNGIGIFLNAGE